VVSALSRPGARVVEGPGRVAGPFVLAGRPGPHAREYDPSVRPPPAASLARAALALAWIAAPFVGAGTVRWAGGWVYLGLLASGLTAHALFVRRHAPDLAARRARIGEGTPAWDLAWVAIFWPSMLAAPAVAGADLVRLGHAPLPLAAAVAGALLLGFALGLSAGAMATNPWFEGTVRLQPGQRVVDRGPYARVRHPGYAALALWALATPLVLRSRAAFLPAASAIAWVVLRTVLEDAFLRRGLDGYAAYAARVRARLVPGLW
jgi:protein-S-isoprenylcysteine O-methyltransferase Ste14